MRAVRTALVSLTFVLFAACGKGEGGGPSPARTTPPRVTSVPPDTAPIPAAAPRFEAVRLPPEFPSDFPLPPGRVVVEASATRDGSGVFGRVALAVEGNAEDEYNWYRRALIDAGWQIAAEGRRDGISTLHATQGESYVDLTVRAHPESDAEEWILIEASIWKLEPL